jgi:hypothetical protein
LPSEENCQANVKNYPNKKIPKIDLKKHDQTPHFTVKGYFVCGFNGVALVAPGTHTAGSALTVNV